MRRHLIVMAITIGFARSVIAADAPEDVVRRYCNLDEQGARLSSERWKETAALVTWPDEPGWDEVTVITGFRIASVKTTGDQSTVTVAYDVVGVNGKTMRETVPFKLTRINKRWQITEPQIQPHAKSAMTGDTVTLTCTARSPHEEHELTLEIDGGSVIALSYSNTMTSGEEGGAYFCELELTSSNSQWLRAGNKTRVVENDSERESYTEIELLRDGSFRVNFDNVSTMQHCGFGAEFPNSIVVKRLSAVCSVDH